MHHKLLTFVSKVSFDGRVELNIILPDFSSIRSSNSEICRICVPKLGHSWEVSKHSLKNVLVTKLELNTMEKRLVYCQVLPGWQQRIPNTLECKTSQLIYNVKEKFL